MAMRKVTPEKMDGMVPETSQPYYPSFHISTDHLPEAKKWEVGKTYMITLKVKQTGFSMRQGRDKKEQGHADFDIVGIDPQGEAKGDKPTRYTEK